MKEAVIISFYAVALAFLFPLLLIAYVLGKGGKDQSEINARWDMGAE